MTKRIVSLLLCAVLLAGSVPAAAAAADSIGTAAFSDIADGEIAEAANALRSMGVVAGTTETTYSPESPLTRAQVCKIIISAMGIQDQVSSYARKRLFSDVSASSVFAGYINLAYTKGVFQGYGDGTFGPGKAITYGQLAAVLLRMLGYTTGDIGSVWPTDYTSFCERLGLNGGLALTPYQTLTRGQAAVLVYNALKADTASGKAYYTTLSEVSSVHTVTVLDVDIRQNDADGLLRYYAAANGGAVAHCRQERQITSAFEGYTGTLLLNASGHAVGFLPESCDGRTGILQDAEDDRVTVSGTDCKMTDDAVAIVGETVYSWKSTGYLQANCYLNRNIRMLQDDIGNVTCVYIPVEDETAAAELAVVSTQPVLLISVDAEDGAADGELLAYVMEGNAASAVYFDQAKALSAEHEGQIGTLLLNKENAAVGFIPSAEECAEVTVSSAKLSGIVDRDGATHRIPGDAVVIAGDAVYPWKDSGYLRVDNHAGKTVRLYYDEHDSVVYIQLLSGGVSADTEVVVAETVTAATELFHRFGISGACSITKNGAPAQKNDLAQHDAAYYDNASRTLRASDYQFTGYIESAYPNIAEAETITVGGNTFSVVECAWESLGSYALGDRVTLLLTDDLKVAMATNDKEIVADILGVLATDGRTVRLLGSGLTMTADSISAKDSLRGRIVGIRVYRDELTCHEYESSGAGVLDVSTRTLGKYELAPSCAIYEHTALGSSDSYVYSLSGVIGEASSDFEEIFWTDTIAAASVTAHHLNSAGKVDMLLLKDVTGNGYEYGKATKYTGVKGINLGSYGLPAYNSAVTITNAANGGEGSKRICTQYDAQGGVYLGVSAGAYDANYQKVVSVRRLTEVEDVESRSFFLADDTWYVVADEAEIPVSKQVQIFVEASDRWLCGEEGLKSVLAMGKAMTVYYDRSASTGAQIRVIAVNS